MAALLENNGPRTTDHKPLTVRSVSLAWAPWVLMSVLLLLTGLVRQQEEDTLRAQEVAEQRVQAGVDSEQTGKQARLASARAHLRLIQAEGSIDVLRTTLSQLTGVPVNSLGTAPDSVPSLPEVPKSGDPAKAQESSPAVLFAQQHAIAQSFRARGEHRSLWPSVDFATQYAVLAKFNNWTQFFPNNVFERNNATVGVVIRFPFFKDPGGD